MHLIKVVLTILMFLFYFFVSSILADSSPKLNKGHKWRIGYYEGGPYSHYTDTMRMLVNGLIDLGWIRDKHPPQYSEEIPKPYMDWLSRCDSPYLSFDKEDSYSANWDERLRSQLRDELLNKLQSGDLDLVIAMRTWAGLDLANNKHAVPVLVLSTSDPIGAGIIKRTESDYQGLVCELRPGDQMGGRAHCPPADCHRYYTAQRTSGEAD